MVISTRLLCQMQANSSGAEFLSTISKFMKRMNFVIACLRPSQNVKLGIFTGSLAVEVKNRILSGQIQLLLLIASQTFFRLVGSSFFYGENKSFPSRHKLAEQTGQVWRDSSS